MRVFTFEEQFEVFLAEQKKLASPRRLEMLERDLSGTVKLFKEGLWPVFQTFDGFELEYEFVGANGVRIFIDVFYVPYRFGFECEGFSAHAETITRDRFSFEKSRVRTMLLHGCVYVPFSWDELDKKGPQCRSYVHELLSRYRNLHLMGSNLSLDEREVIRCALSMGRPVYISDLTGILGKKKDYVNKVIRTLLAKGLIEPVNESYKRNRTFTIVQDAVDMIR